MVNCTSCSRIVYIELNGSNISGIYKYTKENDQIVACTVNFMFGFIVEVIWKIKTIAMKVNRKYLLDIEKYFEIIISNIYRDWNS